MRKSSKFDLSTPIIHSLNLQKNDDKTYALMKTSRYLMKIFLKLLMALVVLAVIAPFYLKNQQGAPLMSLNDIKMPNLSTPPIPDSVKSVASEISDNIPSSIDSNVVQEKSKLKVHKWKDEDGVWHFSNIDESSKGTNSEVIIINPGKNNFTSAPVKQPQQKVNNIDTHDVENVTPNILLPLTHGQATMDQAKKIQELLEQRAQIQQQMMP